MITNQDINQTYACDGVTQFFPVTIAHFGDNLRLLIFTSTDTVIELVKGLDWTYQSSDSSVILSAVWPTGDNLYIESAVPPTQEVDFMQNDPLPPEVLEGSLDKLTLLTMQSENSVNGAICHPESDAGKVYLPFAAERANKYIRYNEFGDPEMVDQFDASGGIGLPPGGNTDDVLKKKTTGDYDVKWEQNLAVYVGEITWWFSNKAIPPNRLVCDGTYFDTVLYPQLFELLGTNILPNLKGIFPGAQGTQGTHGGAEAIGTIREDLLESHSHTASFAGNALPAHTHNWEYQDGTADAGSLGNAKPGTGATQLVSAASAGTPSGSVTVVANGGVETRPAALVGRWLIVAR